MSRRNREPFKPIGQQQARNRLAASVAGCTLVGLSVVGFRRHYSFSGLLLRSGSKQSRSCSGTGSYYWARGGTPLLRADGPLLLGAHQPVFAMPGRLGAGLTTKQLNGSFYPYRAAAALNEGPRGAPARAFRDRADVPPRRARCSTDARVEIEQCVEGVGHAAAHGRAPPPRIPDRNELKARCLGSLGGSR